MTDHTTDSPTGGETLEEWDGTAGTAVAYIRTLEADRARLRAEVERLTAERDEASQSALDWCVGSLPARYNDLRDGTRAEILSFALYLYARSLTSSIASEKQRAVAAEARASRLEEALRTIRHGWDLRREGLRDVARRALNPEGGEDE